MSTRFRTPTSQSYGLKATHSSAPKMTKEEDETVVPDPVPTYKFADKQRGAIDTEAEQRDKEDEEIRESQGKNPNDHEQPKTTFKAKEKTVIKNDKHDRPSTETFHGAKVFEAFWSRETDYDLEEVTFTEKNSWTPNAMAMFEILDAAAQFVTENRTAQKSHTDYLDYGVACYYAIMFYIQILRAQQAAGHLTGQNLKLLRRFDKKFRPEELPISCILEPFFSSITSCLLPDSKYTWIVPDVAPGLFSATMANFAAQNKTIQHGGVYLQPMVPFMLAILRTAITQARQNELGNEMTVLGNQDANNHALRFFNDKDQYIHARVSNHNLQDYFGMDIQNNALTNDGRNTIFYTVGVSYPFHADLDTLNTAAPKWRRSSFNTLNQANLADGTRVINNLSMFLHMEEDDDLDWFRQLILQAGIHARFFGEVKSFSDIPTTGGLETLITCRHVKGRAGAAIDFANVYLGADTATLPLNTDPWYSDRFRKTNGQFFTTRNGYKRQEVLQAMTFAVNASIYVGAAPNTVGEDVAHYRKGPYWTNKEWTATRFQGAGQLGKPMFSGWQELIQTSFAEVKPKGY